MAVGGYREVPGANPGGGIVPKRAGGWWQVVSGTRKCHQPLTTILQETQGESTKNISGEEAQKREARKHAG